MMIRTSSLLGAMAVIAALCACAAAQDNLLVNGDFEDTTDWGDPGTPDTPVGWTSKDGRSNAASQQSGADAIGGSGTSAYMASFPASDPDRRDIQQVLDAATSPQWQLDFDFASEDPGGEDDRSLSGGAELSDGRIALRVVDVGDDGVGDLQLYHTGPGWQPIPELVGSVTFDPDVSTSPQVNHLTINGRFDEESPVYDVTVTNAGETAFTATGLSFYQSTPATGAGVTDVNFNTFISAGNYLLDNCVLTDNSNQPIPGDANLDDIVNDADASILAAHWQQTSMGWGDGDFNGDTVVNDADASILAAHWQESQEGASPVPEPGVLALLAGCLLPGLILLSGLKRRSPLQK